MVKTSIQRIVFIDVEKCIGCYTCVIACKMEHSTTSNSTGHLLESNIPSLIRIFQIGPEIRDGKVHQYFIPILCLHCDNPPCIPACPVNAIYKDAEGIVHVDQEKCIGCKLCFDACPYHAPQYTQDGKMKICDLCFHRLREGRKTACEAHCPAKCIYICKSDEVCTIIGRDAPYKIEKFHKQIKEICNSLTRTRLDKS